MLSTGINDFLFFITDFLHPYWLCFLWHGMVQILISDVLCFRSERETWIKLKYLQRKFASLEIFLKNCQNLNKGIIKNLARMKVRHEEKDVGQLPVGRTDSKKSKLFKRKLAIKGAKSKVDNRKSAPAGMTLSDLTSKEYENLETMASNFLHNDEAASSDSHDEDRSRSGSQRESPDDSKRRRASSTSAVAASSSNEGRERGGSVDSTLSEDGHTGDKAENDDTGVVVDEEKSLQDDREKAIAVLKRVHPSRVCRMHCMN